MSELGFLNLAKQLLSHSLYPDFLRAWKKDPYERIPRAWQSNYKNSKDPKSYPRNFFDFFIYLGFTEDSVHRFNKSKDPNVLNFEYHRSSGFKDAPIIGRDGTLIYNSNGQFVGEDFRVILNLPMADLTED